MATREDIMEIDEKTEMLFKDEQAKELWDDVVQKNSTDPYARGIVTYARRWAKYMQTLIAEGKTIAEVAEQASFDADLEGITGFMYGCAVKTLSQCWKYGEELRVWHNSKYGVNAGTGVVNPAILTL